jgi:hypothetical protein
MAALRILFNILWVTGAVSGCAAGGVTTPDGARLALPSAAFRSYAEGVFREQNRLADALAFALEDLPADSTAREQTLLDAETALLNACAPLNELAAARRDARPLGRLEQARLARQAPACDAQSRQTQAVLQPAKGSGR